LPAFIRNHIPASIWDGIARADSLIDNTILPKLTNIKDTIEAHNLAVGELRAHAASLREKLLYPGSILSGVDLLTDDERKRQELKIDDVASRKYNEDTDKYAEDDAEITAEIIATEKLFETEIPPLPFMSIEDIKPGVNPEIIKEPFETWFVGGYSSTY